MTLDQINQLMGFKGALEGGSTENGIHYESYKWVFSNDYFVGCDFENGVATVSGIQDPINGFRNSLGESTRD